MKKINMRMVIICLIMGAIAGFIEGMLIKILKVKALNIFNVFYAIIVILITGAVAAVMGTILLRWMEKKKPGSVLGPYVNEIEKAKKQVNVIGFGTIVVVSVIAADLGASLLDISNFFLDMIVRLIIATLFATVGVLTNRILIKQIEKRGTKSGVAFSIGRQTD